MGNSGCFRRKSSCDKRYKIVNEKLSTSSEPFSFFHDDSITCLSRTQPDDESLFSGSEDRSVVHFNWKTRKIERKFVGGHTKGILSLEYSEENDVLISGGRDKTVQVYKRNNPNPLFSTNLHKLSVTSLSFLENHPNLFLSGSRDCCLSIFDLNKEKQTSKNYIPRNLITDFCFFPKSPNFVQVGESMKIRIFDSHNDLELIHEVSDEDTLKHILLSCDVSRTNENHFIVSSKGFGSDGCYSRIYDLRKLGGGCEYFEMRGHQQSVLCARYVLQDQYVCTISNDVTFKIFNTVVSNDDDDDDDEVLNIRFLEEKITLGMEEFGVTPNCLSLSKNRKCVHVSGFPGYLCTFDLEKCLKGSCDPEFMCRSDQ